MGKTFFDTFDSIDFLCVQVAETGRRALRPGEVRRGGYGARKNDDLVPHLVQTREVIPS